MNRPYLSLNIVIIVFLHLVTVRLSAQESDSLNIPVPADHSCCSDNWIARDKLHHFTYSALLACAGSSLSYASLDADRHTCLEYGMVFSFTTGLTKELRDARNPHNHFCWKDLAADVAGIFFGLWIMERWK